MPKYFKPRNRTAKRRPARSYANRRVQYRRKPMVFKYNPTYKGINRSFLSNMKKYNTANLEKKILPMKNYLNGPASAGYEQDLPCAGLTSAGLETGALSCLVLQTGKNLTDMNDEMNTDSGQTIAYAMGGYDATQGTGVNQIVGKYCKFTSSYLNVNITMDPVDYNNEIAGTLANVSPHQFRVIQVKARRGQMPQQGNFPTNIGEPSIGYNLFLSETGTPKGIIDDIATQDVFTWMVNKQFWTVLKDERFTLSPTVISRTTENPIALSNGTTKHPNSRFKKYWLPKPKNKVRYVFGTAGVSVFQPVDYNFVVHTIILAKNKSSGEYASNHWSVQTNGASQFIDE